MPYKVEKRGKKWSVINPNTGKVYGSHSSKKKARRQQSALYVNAPPKNESFENRLDEVLFEKELTTKTRKGLDTSSFAIPSERKYPIHDISHARNALSRVAQHGTPEEKAKVRAAVKRKYPSIDSDD